MPYPLLRRTAQDALKPFKDTLLDDDNTPFSISGRTLHFRLVRRTGTADAYTYTTVIDDVAATSYDGSTGVATYAPAVGEVTTPGTYYRFWRFKDSVDATKTQTFPVGLEAEVELATRY